jgi:hypothetical protein
VLRSGVVNTHFHQQRVNYNEAAMDEFLASQDLADSALYILARPLRTTIKALNGVPTAQRAWTRFAREWNERHYQKTRSMIAMELAQLTENRFQFAQPNHFVQCSDFNGSNHQVLG